MKKHFQAIMTSLVALFLLAPCAASAAAWNAPRAGNPLVPGYFADPCLRKFGDTYYLYATPDGWDLGAGPFCIWTSKDFVHWTANMSNWPTTYQKWAPSVAFRNNTYYMYSQIPCQIWVGTSISPLGPWTNPIAGGGCFIPDQTPSGTITLDGECFIDDDGQAYMYYGTWWTPTVVKLNPDMTSTVAGSAIQYFAHAGYTPPNGTVTGCMEAPYMFKHGGRYYYMYSDNSCFDSTYNVKYSIGDSPLGPWTYGANNPILATNLDHTIDGPGHHTMLEDCGKVYIIYHRHDNPHDPDGVHRQIAVDELVFNPDGSIAKVVPTHDGVGYLAASTKKDTNLAVARTATASSSAGLDWLPANAADENNGTLWKAGSYTYPQWLMIDLGAVTGFKRCETEFQFAQVAYKYKIEYSSNGTTWTTFADRTANAIQGSPMIDSAASAASGRYVRLTMTGDGSPSRPAPEVGVWNFRIYDGVDKADPTPVVDAGPDKNGTMAFPTLPLAGSLVDAASPTTYIWSKASGPGTVVFSDNTKLGTIVTFGAIGTYVLQLAGNDGTHTGTDTVTYTVASAGDRIISYPMDDATGVDVADTSGNLQDGILMNGPVRGTGAVNQCFSFDGTDDSIYVPPLSSYSALSICAWVKPDTIVGYGSILCGNGSATGAPGLTLQSDGKVHFNVRGNTTTDVSSNFAFTPGTVGTWTHVAAVYSVSGKTVRFYINGALDSTRTLTTAQNAVMTTGARIGGWDGGGRGFDGKIDELVLYNRTLTAAEVSALTTGVVFSKVSDAKALADGQSVTLKAASVTYAPTDANLARSTTSFYIEDPTGLNGLLVEDGGAGRDTAVADSGASITGTMRTDATTGERYLECSSLPEVESAPVISPLGKTLANVTNDALVGILVKVTGAMIRSIAADRKSMVISDGSPSGGSPLHMTVLCEFGTLDTDLAAANVAEITGVVSQTSPTARVMLLKSYWRTSPPVDMMSYKLQEYYPFDETTGTTAADLSGYHRTATLDSPGWAAGKFGNALSFNGTSTTAVIPDMGTFPALTIAGWVNLGSLNDWQSIMHCDGWDANDTHLSFRVGGDLFFSVNGNNPVDVSSGSIYNSGTLNTWKWVAVVYDSSARTVKFYLNGSLFSTVGYSTAVAANLQHGMHLGSWDGGSRFFGGRMDELRFYGRALTDAEITTLYNYSPNTVAITASAGAGGSISPAGAVAIPRGGNQTFTITPNAGYLIDSVTVDGVDQGAIASFAFTNVIASHAISATFKVDPDAVMDPNLVAWLKFDETSGIITADASGHGNGATLNGGFTWVAGKINHAVSLGGSNGHAALPDGVVAALGDFTIAAWVNLNANDTWNRIFDFGTGAAVNMFLTPKGGPGVVRYAITTGGAGGEQQINGTAALATGAWQHVAVTLAGTTGTVYVNGLQVGQNTNMTLKPSSLGNTTQNYIGKSQYNDPYLGGVVDDFRIYPKGLSAAEVLSVYQGTRSYADWLTDFAFAPGADTLSAGDPDGDGMTNQQEFAFGLDPTLGSSVNPITVPLDKTSGKFSYTRLAASGLVYHVFTSTDLRNWVKDPVTETVTGTHDGVDTVEVAVAAHPVNGTLFVRVVAPPGP